jgi:hypothetical protein
LLRLLKLASPSPDETVGAEAGGPAPPAAAASGGGEVPPEQKSSDDCKSMRNSVRVETDAPIETGIVCNILKYA